MEGLLKDLRFGIRMLIRTPLLSVTAVLTLGLGVGVTTFAYSISYVFMVMPVEDADRLMAVRRTTASGQGSVPFHDYRDIRDRQTVFQNLAAGYSGTINLAGEEGPPVRVQGSYVTANAFTGLRISPILGRGFLEGDDAPGAPALLLLGFETWQNHYAADAAVVGRTVRVNGEPATVIGVMPEGFGFPIIDEVWVPLRYDPTTLPRGGGVWLSVWGYLREGVTPGAATADLQIIARQLEVEFPEQNEGVTAQVLPFVDGFLPVTQLYDLAGVLMAMVLGVLVVACANVANLLLARATIREKDVAIRSALGATRGQVIRQLLAEAGVIAVVGGLLGLLFVQLAFPWYEGLVAGIPRPYWWVYSLKTSTLVFTMGVTIAAALLAGTVPAIRASGAAVGTVLRDESRGSSSLRVGRFSRGLVVAELAVSCALLIGAGLANRSVMDLNRLDLGFDVATVMTARVGLFELDYPDPVTRNQFFHELLEEVRSDPGTAAALTSILPGTGQSLRSFRVEGASYPLATDVPTAGHKTVSLGYFETFGIEVEEGRDFFPSEVERDGEPVVIVNRAFVDRYLGGRGPMGRRIGLGTEELPSIPWMRIVGVVSNTYQGLEIFSTEEQKPEAIYRPLGLADPRFMSLVVRTRGVPEELTPQLREAVARVDPNLPLYWVQSMEAALEEARFIQSGMGVLFAVVSVVGLFLAVVGLYGVMDFSVSTRLREMGVRIAMGASRWSIMRLVFRRVYLQLGLGSALGLALGFALGKSMSATLIEVESWDAVVSVTVVMILGLTCTAAALLPALKALQVDPVEALRAE